MLLSSALQPPSGANATFGCDQELPSGAARCFRARPLTSETQYAFIAKKRSPETANRSSQAEAFSLDLQPACVRVSQLCWSPAKSLRQSLAHPCESRDERRGGPCRGQAIAIAASKGATNSAFVGALQIHSIPLAYTLHCAARMHHLLSAQDGERNQHLSAGHIVPCTHGTDTMCASIRR